MATQTDFLSNLTLSSAIKQRAVPALVKRRNKLIQKLSEQRELALATCEGRNFAPKRLRTVRDATTGQRMVRETSVRIKAWWWVGVKGETLLSIYYGSRLLELAPGRTTIHVGLAKDLPAVINTVIKATQNCELDAQIEASSIKLRDGFKR